MYKQETKNIYTLILLIFTQNCSHFKNQFIMNYSRSTIKE